MNQNQPITTDQAATILFLTGEKPKVSRDKWTGALDIEHEDRCYYGRADDSDDYSFSLRRAADRLISEVTVYLETEQVFRDVEEATRKAIEEAEAEAAEQARLEEEANRTPLEWATISWDEAVEVLDTFDALSRAGASIASALVNHTRAVSEDPETDLAEGLCFIQQTVIDHLLDLDDVPFFEGSVLAVAADVIQEQVGCDEDDGIEDGYGVSDGPNEEGVE